LVLLKEALDADRKNIVEENLSTGEACYFDVDKIQRQIYPPDDNERQRVLRDSPGQVALVRTYDVSGEKFLYWATLGYSEPYRRDGRVYQLLYRRIIDDVEGVSAQIKELCEPEKA